MAPSQEAPESVQHYIKEGILYKPVIPNIHDWPIARLFRRKQAFVREVILECMDAFEKLTAGDEKALHDLIAQTMYLERIRIEEDPWKVDPPDEKKFWQNIKRQLIANEQQAAQPGAYYQHNLAILETIISRYANEIASTFKPGSYHFAKRVLPFIFSTLLNASAGKTIKAVMYHNLHLQERVHLIGEIQAIRNLATKGTIILVPTHISNLDSIIIGWGLHALGLPAFIYGAGLNLYNNAILAYFMQRLGAYKVDRRKRNPIYRKTLDTYSTIAIEHGVHSLFFPGGTRCRSGEIEKKLKLGLLGTAMEAQRRMFI
ncbi:MAG: glycerol-3-phosphate acyltransferase, partial [Bacteroidetes bacterium]